MKKNDLKYFTKAVVDWNEDVDRNMPWEGEKDPYLVWLSEILLQQTRVEQGLPYFVRFKQKYPSIAELAAADDDEVFRLWQGLGYYSRCRNLLFTARYIAKELGGAFPNNYEDIVKLKGIGPYTAAAIASFAFGESIAVVDGNVKRVISRFFGVDDAVDEKKGVARINKITNAAIQLESDPAIFNQAIMNFGAIHCKPKKPLCASCPLNEKCFAQKMDRVNFLPKKTIKIKKQKRYFVFLHIEHKNEILIHQRTAKDIWQSLYDLPLIEVALDQFEGVELSVENVPMDIDIKKLKPIGAFGIMKQQLTHQTIHARFLKFSVDKRFHVGDKDYLWKQKSTLNTVGFPKLILDYLKQEFLQSELPFN